MKKLWKKLMALVCLSAMILSSVSALAADDFDVSGDKTADPTELACPNRETEITLSLPSAEYKNKVDLVFVMDDSTSTVNSNFDFPGKTSELFEKIIAQNPGIELKVAVVKFRGYATDMLGTGLTVYDDSSKDKINTAIANDSVDGHGSNAHSGLVMAEQLLKGDTEVKDSNKYVVFLTDGKNYIWNNEKNEPTTIYAQYLRKTAVQDLGYPVLNQYANSYNREQGNVYLTVSGIDRTVLHFAVGDNLNTHDPSNSDYFRRLYNSDNEELLSTATVYDSPAYYSGYYPEYANVEYSLNNGDPGTNGPRSGAVTQYTVTNAPSGWLAPYKTYYEYTPDSNAFWKDIRYLQINPYEIASKDETNHTATYDTTKVNEDFFLWHPDCMMKGTFITAHFWKEHLVDNYNAACIASFKKGSGGGANIVGSFVNWIVEESDYAADVTNSDDIAAVFEGIDNDIRFKVDAGSTVTDVIGDDFTLVDSDKASCFKLTVGGTEVEPKLEGGKWLFGNTPDYEISYDEDTKTITWLFNVPIDNANPVTLTYKLLLKEDAATGTYDTNKSAVLHYVPTNDEVKPGDFTFAVPKVEYTACAEVKVEKIWDDNNNEAGKRPEKVEVVLMNDGKELMALTLSDENDWAGTFVHNDNVHIPENILDKLSVKEVSVDGYECEVAGDAKDGFTITNTYVPPTTEAETTEAATTEAAATEAETTAPETTEEQTTPPTGDNMNILPFAAIFVLAAAAFVVLSRTKAQDER